MPPLLPAPHHVDRFRTDLEALTGEAPDGGLAVAVSGGPDSLALLLLAAAAYPGAVRAATVDHKLRPEAAAEAGFVGDICASLGVPHAILSVPPHLEIVGGSRQAKARAARYALLGEWLVGSGGRWLATAHHLDDQAETILMRLNRGAGAAGLSAIRRMRRLAEGSESRVVRPLLGWRKAELATIVEEAGIGAVDDPSNRSADYDRTQVRALLAATPALDPERLAASAAHLAEAEQALEWSAGKEWEQRASIGPGHIHLDARELPPGLLRRLVGRAIDGLRRDAGLAPDWRRDKLADALARLQTASRITIAEVQITSDATGLRFEPAPPRRSR